MPEYNYHQSWGSVFKDELSQEYIKKILFFLREVEREGRIVYPSAHEYFRAMELTPFENVKVVILGQDPYHRSGQAHGLSFSVRPEVPIPPSLINIYKELASDLGITPARHGFLEYWAIQGVLLINSVLTVEEGLPGSHQGKGWEQFTDLIISELNERRNHIVFILWGSYAQKKCFFIDYKRHLVIKSAHPSPLSAYRGFFGSRPFSNANNFLESHGMKPIDWQLPDITPLSKDKVRL